MPNELLGACKPSPSNSRPILFSLFDAGETLAFTPVMTELRKAEVPFRIISMATSQTFLASCPECIDLKRDCGVSHSIEPAASHEDRLFSTEDLALIKACIDPKILVTGAPSRVQLQIAEAFQSAGTRVISYFDAFSPVIKDSIGSEFLKISDEFWVPSQTVARQASPFSHRGTIEVTGQPTLETWALAKAAASLAAIRAALPGYDSNQKTILFVRGYGNGYEESLRLFLQSASAIETVQILISAHPRMGDALERRILLEYPSVHAIFVPRSVGKMNAAFVSDLLVSQNSTFGIQALFAGKMLIYVDPANTGFHNFATDQGLSPILRYTEEVTAAILLKLQSNAAPIDPYALGGIPRNSAQLMAEKLIRP